MRDLRAWADLDPFGAEVETELESLEQDVYHRLVEPPATNLDDLDRGLGIDEMLSGPYDRELPRRIEAECRKDPRVAAVRARPRDLQLAQTGAIEAMDVELESDDEELGKVAVEVSR